MFKGIKVVKGNQVYSGLTIKNLVSMISCHNPSSHEPLNVVNIPDEMIPDDQPDNYKDAA